jgi:hypothetical protein
MSEKRKRQRLAVQPQKIPGELVLCVGDERFSICQVRDVSPFGLGVETNVMISNGVHAQLSYKNEITDIKVEGTVVWSRCLKTDQDVQDYRIGILLKPNAMGKNIRFYDLLMQPDSQTI